MWPYWKSPDATKLFNPGKDETVIKCLARRDTLLWRASVDDDILCTLVDDLSNPDELTAIQVGD